MSISCPYCGGSVKPQARFCPACGRQLPVVQPPSSPTISPTEATLSAPQRMIVNGDSLDVRNLIDMVETALRWWQQQLSSGTTSTRQQAAEAIEDLSRILQSLAQQLSQGRDTIRITRRLPALRKFSVACPTCGHGNRQNAKFCQVCGTFLLEPASKQTHKGTPMPLRMTIAARTDQGQVRRNNQDAIYTGTLQLSNGVTAYLCLVADGMGGAAAGEEASRIASEVIQAQVREHADPKRLRDDKAWKRVLDNASVIANQRVYEESRKNTEHQGMGTTLTVALIIEDRLYLSSVGDSRAYLMNSNGVTEDGATSAQLTSDHSLVARLVDIGHITPEQARTHPQRNLLYRSIGTEPAIEVDTFAEQLEPGDILLLCSDGLVNHVEDHEIAKIALTQADMEKACEQLVALANQRGGRDNISVVIVRVERDN